MKPSPGFSIGPEDYMFDEDSRELLEGMEGASVQEKLVDTDFFNIFEVSGTNWRAPQAGRTRCRLLGTDRRGMRPCCCFVSCMLCAASVALSLPAHVLLQDDFDEDDITLPK